ncbi:hypothetical protein HYQ45_014044 [Verticillium longisporum]|uniref:Uncharacterized protein n=1 Tax=Verticillium longisporum TaxID=100787 RepID=A0A8I3AIT3_VERLO|nr:hypothetical protein HYQ45_014044 [Verticillium longisporum]
MGPEHDRSMSPEALSSLFQQRPMRPLPKRRLRERLSPEVADTIEYPPASQNSSPLFLLPGIVRDERSSSVGRNYTVIRDPGYEGAPIANHEAGESDEEEVKRFASSKVVRRSHPEILIDGYDSFENTNNKKKRKIPTAGDNTLNANSWVGRGPKIRQPQWAANSNENTGIISNAIANAGKVFSEPGQENISLLSQHSNTSRPRPASAQFTFTCDSQVPGTQWPGMDPAVHSSLPAYGGANRTKHASMGTQTAAANAGANQQGAPVQGNAGTPAAAKKKKSRRRAERDLKMAAAHRCREAREKAYHNPPRPEDMWICEFCEYEQIFGEPPYALIRQYEIKDQKARRQEQERKRLLEKAKAKSRKGKKANSGKPGAKNTDSSQPGPQQQPHRVDGGHTDGTRSQTNSTDEDEEGYHNGESDYDGRSFTHDDPPMTLSDDPDPEYPDDERLACPCASCVAGAGHAGVPA